MSKILSIFILFLSISVQAKETTSSPQVCGNIQSQRH